MEIERGVSFGIIEGEVSADLGIAALGFRDALVLPDRGGRVRAAGEWTPPRFWGRSDVARPNWHPNSHDPCWTIERFSENWPDGMHLSDRARERVAAALREHLAVDIPRERWGEVLVMVPDARVWTAAEPSAQ